MQILHIGNAEISQTSRLREGAGPIIRLPDKDSARGRVQSVQVVNGGNIHADMRVTNICSGR